MTTYHKVRVNVKDQNNNPVVGSTVRTSAVGYMNSITDSSGNAYFYDIPSDITFTYTASNPDGYTCVNCSGNYRVSTQDIWIQFTMEKADAPDYDLHILVRDENSDPLAAAITIDGVHRGYTGTDGKMSIILPGDQYYAVTAVKSGYEKAAKSVNLSCDKIVNLTLTKDDPFVCSEGATRGYTTCPDGAHIYTEVCKSNTWVTTGDVCPAGCFLDVEVTDEDDLPLDAKVCIGSVCQQTGTDGITTFSLTQGTYYTAIATKDEYTDYNGFGERSFTADGASDYLALRLKSPDVPDDPGEEGEVAEITNVTYPATARTGDEIDVIVYFKNIGDEVCELRARLLDAGQYDEEIDTEPDVLFENPAPGLSGQITLTTNWHYGAMPAHDWELAVELIEINRITNSVQKVHDRRDITIELDTPDPDDPDDPDVPGDATGELTLDAPAVMVAGAATVTGTAPPGQAVQIVVKNKYLGADVFAADTVLKTVTSCAKGEYTADIVLDEFGAVNVYARIKKAGWLGIDILEKDIVSSTSTIWVLTYPIILALVLLTVLVADKATGGRLKNMLRRGK